MNSSNKSPDIHKDSPERQIEFLASALDQANANIRIKIDELSLVRRVGDAISHHTSPWALSSELVNAIAETVNCKFALIYSGVDAGMLELQAVSSLFSSSEQFPKTLRRARMIRWLEQTHSPIEISDLTGCPDWCYDWPFPRSLSAWLCVPLLTRNDIRGVLCLADDTPGAFDEKTLRTLMVVVPQIASAFANIGLYDHLRASEMKYRSLVEGMQDAVYICDKQWQIIEANPAAEGLFGEIVGKSLPELFADSESAGRFMEDVRRARFVQNFETELRGTENKRVVTLISGVMDGERCHGVIKDMTERTRLLEQVTQAQKMESIGTLASGVAHDFNNILGIILPNAELIKLRLGAGSPALKFADVIINASTRAAQITKQLLSLSRKNPLSVRVVSLNDSIRTTSKLLEETLERRIQMELDLATEPTTIKADETQIGQVLLNLAINARDAMPEGGTLKFSTKNLGDSIEARVSDTGTGIDRKIISKIFDPFFTTKDKSKGTGLGLSVVYGIVKQAGGTIEVESAPGVGTEFIMKFPHSRDAGRNSSAQHQHVRGGKETILIVDDEPEMISLLQTALKELGYTIRTARNGMEAIESASEDIHLIILDMIMPVMDGITALRGIRQKNPDVKVLISSGYTSPEKAPMLERIGIEGFVQKPFELAKLASTVRDVLDGVAV